MKTGILDFDGSGSRILVAFRILDDFLLAVALIYVPSVYRLKLAGIETPRRASLASQYLFPPLSHHPRHQFCSGNRQTDERSWSLSYTGGFSVDENEFEDGSSGNAGPKWHGSRRRCLSVSHTSLHVFERPSNCSSQIRIAGSTFPS